jgi:hypothetical protein
MVRSNTCILELFILKSNQIIIPFRRSVQDYKIHIGMEMVIFFQVMLYNHKGI